MLFILLQCKQKLTVINKNIFELYNNNDIIIAV